MWCTTNDSFLYEVVKPSYAFYEQREKILLYTESLFLPTNHYQPHPSIHPSIPSLRNVPPAPIHVLLSTQHSPPSLQRELELFCLPSTVWGTGWREGRGAYKYKQQALVLLLRRALDLSRSAVALGRDTGDGLGILRLYSREILVIMQSVIPHSTSLCCFQRKE